MTRTILITGTSSGFGRETAERLAAALRAGETPVLLGGSGISGAYALTFACGEENIYILADRVIASL